MWWLIVAQSPSGDSVEWLQYGVLGLVVVALVTGLLWAKPAVDRILRENDRLQNEVLAELRALRQAVEGKRRDPPAS